MLLTGHYIPPLQSLWQGRADAPKDACFFQIVKLADLQQVNLSTLVPPSNQLAFGIVGFCCDEGIRRNQGRPGAAEGPATIRRFLAGLPMQRPAVKCYDFGDIICLDHDLEAAQSALAEIVSTLLDHHIVPVLLGGGHEIAWGHFQGIAKKILSAPIGIINFDAHLDMRPLLPNSKGTSGTPFLQIAKLQYHLHQAFHYHCIGIQRAANTQVLFDTAKLHRTHILYADDIHQSDRASSVHFVERALADCPFVYVSICLDVFASAYAPGVSAPQPLGITPWQVVPLLRKLAGSGKIISYDVAELSPHYDIDSRTAKLAAHLVYEMIHHHQNQ